MTTRDTAFDKLISTFFDRLWANEAYLGGMGQLMKQNFAMRQQWNKNLEQFWSLWQLPNQEMQQRTLHGVNTLLSEYRFEQEETNERLAKMEQDMAELKAMITELAKADKAQAAPAKVAAKVAVKKPDGGES
ncbi:MAG: hypothetical protein ACAI44_39250 [Candidatus Sericytochromatia bacterium]